MLKRSNHLLFIAVLGLVTWGAATDVAAKIMIYLVPGALPQLARFAGRSETLAIVLAAAVLAAAPALVMMAMRETIRRIGKSRHREISGFAEAWAQLAERCELPASWRPRHARRDATADSPARYDAGTLYLAWNIADDFCAGRARQPDDYDFACFVILHEIAHARSGDARLGGVRDNLAVTCAAMVGSAYALGSASILNPMFLAEILALTLLGAALVLALLRQLSREIEVAADRWAYAQVVRVNGVAAGEAVRRKLLGAMLGVPEAAAALAPHAGMVRRGALLQAEPRYGPLVVLWVAALAAVAWTQQQRIDAPCADCTLFYQGWFDLVAWATAALLTALYLIFIGEARSTGRPARWRNGALALLAAIAGFAALRWWLSWGTLAAIAASQGLVAAARWTFLSNDGYSWAVSVHLAICAVALLWPRRRPIARDKDRAVPTPAADSRRPRFSAMLIRDELLATAESVGRGVALCFGVAGIIMLAGPLLRHAIDPGQAVSWQAAGLSALIAGAGFASYRIPQPMPVALMLAAAAGATFVWTLLQLDFFHRLQLAYMAKNGLDPTSGAVQLMVGARMAATPQLFYENDLVAAAEAGLMRDGVVIAACVVALFAVRLWSRHLAGKGI